MNIKIDIVSDVACPWCYVGIKRLEKALASLPEIETEINWQPFQLDPTVPKEGRNLKEHYITKFGSEEKAVEIFKHMETVGDSEGISFDFMKMERTMNTLPLHMLMFEAEKEGFKAKLKMRFFNAYFENPVDLSSKEVIVEILSEYGWAREKTLEILDDKNLEVQVKQKIAYFQSMGVSGVPFFVFNDKYGVSGAQPPHVLVDMIKNVIAESKNVSQENEGEVCDLDGDC